MIEQQVACNNCGRRVNVSTSRCPFCGASNRQYKKYIAACSIVVFVLFFGWVAFNEIQKEFADNWSNTRSEIPDGTLNSKVFSIGEPITSSSVEAVVSLIEAFRGIRSTIVGDVLPSQGAVFVAVRWSYTNTSQVPISLFSRPIIYLLNSTGARFDPHVLAGGAYADITSTRVKVLSSLNPGITERQVSVFEIPATELPRISKWRIIISLDRKITVSMPDNVHLTN